MKRMNLLASSSLALALVVWLCSPALAGDPQAKFDGDWISLTGKVTQTTLDGFKLDYGKGKIHVELDDWDLYDESQQLKDGERVTVYGRIDDALFEKRSIEAGTVYVYDRNVYYHASSNDEEGDAHFLSFVNVYPYPDDGHWMKLTGKIKEIDGDEFTLALGVTTMTVDVDQMSTNPLDDDGFQKLHVGDRVSVWGYMDYDLFEKRELKAKTIVTIRAAETQSS